MLFAAAVALLENTERWVDDGNPRKAHLVNACKKGDCVPEDLIETLDFQKANEVDWIFPTNRSRVVRDLGGVLQVRYKRSLYVFASDDGKHVTGWAIYQ